MQAWNGSPEYEAIKPEPSTLWRPLVRVGAPAAVVLAALFGMLLVISGGKLGVKYAEKVPLSEDQVLLYRWEGQNKVLFDKVAFERTLGGRKERIDTAVLVADIRCEVDTEISGLAVSVKPALFESLVGPIAFVNTSEVVVYVPNEEEKVRFEEFLAQRDVPIYVFFKSNKRIAKELGTK